MIPAMPVLPSALADNWRSAVGLGIAGFGGCMLYPLLVRHLVDGRAEHHIDGRSPSAQLLAAVAATIEDHKLAVLTDDFPDSMLLNCRERAILDGGVGAGEDSTLASLGASYLGASRRPGDSLGSESRGIFHAIAGKLSVAGRAV